MPNGAHRPSCVLLADLGPMAQAGMTGMLAEHGVEVVSHSAAADLGQAVGRLQPDAVVLDLDGGAPHDLSAIVRRACPATKVVLWARGEELMEVLDPGADAPRFVLGSSPAELRAELLNTPSMNVPEDEPPCPRT